MTKKCPCCKQTKEITEFNLKGNKRYPHIRKGKCKSCERKKPSQMRADSEKKVVKAKRNKLKAVSLMGGKCMNPLCPLKGIDLPACCFDFHHRDPSIKDGNLNRLLKQGMTKAMPELKKCDMLCCICHRILHDNLNSDSA